MILITATFSKSFLHFQIQAKSAQNKEESNTSTSCENIRERETGSFKEIIRHSKNENSSLVFAIVVSRN